MREIVDQLIEERAPWMRRRGPLVTVARPILHALLQYDRTIKVGEAMEPLPGRGGAAVALRHALPACGGDAGSRTSRARGRRW